MSDFRSDALSFLRLQLRPRDLNTKLGHVWRYDPETGRFHANAWPDIDPRISVSKEDVSRALSAFATGTVSSSDLEEWANVIILWEAFEVIGEDRQLVLDTLHEVGNPLTEGALGFERAMSLKGRLDGSIRRI